MRRWISLLTLLAVLGVPSVSLAKKKKKPVQAAKIEKLDIESLDAVFTQVKKIDSKIMKAKNKQKKNKENLNKTLGLKKNTPIRESLQVLKDRAGGNLTVKNDPKSKMPRVGVKGNAAGNIQSSVTAVNQMVKDIKGSIMVLKTVPKDAEKLIKKTKVLPSKLKEEVKSGSIPVSTMFKDLKILKNNIKATTALPKKSKQVLDNMTDIVKAVAALAD